LKKYVAISALSLFFLYQFGKVLSFCFCSISYYQQNNTFHCDCEKQLSVAVATENQNHLPQTPTGSPQFDELFPSQKPEQMPPLFSFLLKLKRPWQKDALYHQYQKNILRPPLV